MGVQQEQIALLGLDTSQISSGTFLFQDNGRSYGNRAYEERELWSLSQAPEFVPETLDGQTAMFAFMNIPIYSRMANCTV